LLVAGLFWEKSTAGWWLISQTNMAQRVEHEQIDMIQGFQEVAAADRIH
jgi:hypothetical protein